MNVTTFSRLRQTGVVPSISLDRPLQYFSGVGPVRAKRLAKLGLHTVGDLLRYFPRAHEDRRLGQAPSSNDGMVAFEGNVEDFTVQPGGKFLLIGRARLVERGKRVAAVWFRRRSPRYDPFQTLRQKIVPGVRLFVYGPWQWGEAGKEIRVEDHDFSSGDQSPHRDRWVPVYPLTEGIDGRWFRGLVWGARSGAAGVLDPLPESVRQTHGLMPLAQALKQFHFPDDAVARDRARHRLAFDEFFTLELALVQVRRKRQEGPPSPVCVPTRSLLSPFRAAMGFDFTPGQRKAINEIFADMSQPRPMNRLLMGDVGSGKTVVAVAAMLLAVEAGHQAVLMAPTEILAEQHARRLSQLLAGLPVRWALLTSGGRAADRRRDRVGLSAGEISIAVGTHALIDGKVAFQNLGLVVIDEQHRFGVDQRAQLVAKGISPHVMLMTATPIPRTLALTLYGDLSVSVIEQRPPGRPTLATRWSTEKQALDAVSRAAGLGRQAYVVFPLVEESERMDLKAVIKGFDHLKSALPGIRVGLLHGRMKSTEKEAVMGAFSRGEIQVLAATPVIEVGIDVPNATVVVVMNAERFGLAQLHQLRGRVGRGIHPSECHVVSGAASADGAERLKLFCRLDDGFALSEEDLRLRGPGQFLGEAQHGLPEFQVGNLVSDGLLIEEARQAAMTLDAGDPSLTQPPHRALAEDLSRRYEHLFRFARTG